MIIPCENCENKFVDEDDILCDSCDDLREEKLENDWLAERMERQERQQYEDGLL